ncbi:hypothetical protein HGRIS_009454 [Hohenbuehelia grisea]|uniref:Vacuolar sorting protein n=1 Tax=Hohenbuehelia grisea TaxID=104357 RepID=A0ABR3J2M0_9AGAR
MSSDPSGSGHSAAALSSQANAQFYLDRAKEFVELHDQVETSVNLLDSLESFLSTFQKDLSAVSGQISELQDRSKDIDNRLKSRKKIEKPLSNLITDITIPPPLATLILDTDVGEPWITAIEDFERKLDTVNARSRVKAARDLTEVNEGLRIVAATKLRAFFLALFQPIRSSVTTNMQVMQTSVLVKYRPLLAFLQRQAPNVAQEVQRSYVGAARVYYETGFRRYIRGLGWIKGRTTDKPELIVSNLERDKPLDVDLARLAYAKLDGPSVTLAYMADDKNHKEPIEALLRSLLIVLLDNATAEYSFISSFFSVDPSPRVNDLDTPLFSPAPLLTPVPSGSRMDSRSASGSDYGGRLDRNRSNSLAPSPIAPSFAAALKAEQANSDAIWKQVLDPVLEYVQTFVKSCLEPPPPVVQILTMIRLLDEVVNEVQQRSCPPLETLVYTLRIQMWPVFQKLMSDNIEALRKHADGVSSGYFSTKSTNTTDASVLTICHRYIVLFNSFVALTEQPEETMIFANLLRLRQELGKLITKHTGQISDTAARATTQCRIYESLLQGFTKGTHFAAHPKSQQEIAYWANLEEEARRKIASVAQTRNRR